MSERDVFVYGTLTDPARVEQVVDEYEFHGPARLHGLQRVEGTYPTLAPGGATDGRVLRTRDMESLDAYEGVDSGLYTRVGIDREDADSSVVVYVGDPDRLDAPATWPGTGAFSDRVREYVRENDVFVREFDRLSESR